MRCLWIYLSALWLGFALAGAARADSLDATPPPPADTVFVIPAGPVAGTVTPAARLTVVDTVAGWARIQIEGWVPVGSVLHRMTASPPAARVEKNSESSGRCQANTKKGKRCTRTAKPGSPYCWQHQP